MRMFVRLGFAMLLTGATALVSGCDSLDTLTLFDSKTKLAGERKEVFPGGVPGVTPGVPPELVKGYREGDASPPAIPGDVKAAELKPRSATAAAGDQKEAEAKPKPKPHAVQTASKPKPAPAAQPAQTASVSSGAPPAAPPGATPAPWPVQQQQQAQPQPQAAWPSAPSSGSIAR